MASILTSTYSPEDISIVITQGQFSHTLSGFAEDSIVNIVRNSPTYELYTGADDTNTRIQKANTSATITISLAQSSNSNDILSELYLRDKALKNSDGMFELLIKDNSGRSVVAGREAYVAVVPDAAFSNSMNTREWEIHLVRSENYIGGNARFDAADAAAIESLGGTIETRWQPL